MSESLLQRAIRAAGGAEKFLAGLTPEQRAVLPYRWDLLARPEQLAPGTAGAASGRTDWSYWLLLAGRSFGKTRAGAEWAITKAKTIPGSHGALVAATADDARKTMLSSGLETVQGASGILAVSRPDLKPVYEPSKRTVTWPNGSVATLYSAEEPDRLRGPQHHWCWVDELAAWQAQAAAWEQLLFGLRLGDRPQACITTTPRPIKIIRDLLSDPRTVVSRGSSFENLANVSDEYFKFIIGRYEGTRLGRQELLGEVLEDVVGALWDRETLDRTRVERIRLADLQRIVVGVDPSGAGGDDSGHDETGIAVCGVGPCSCRGTEEQHGFVLEDASLRAAPADWGRRVVQAFTRWQADRVVAEQNYGGAMVGSVIETAAAELGRHVSVSLVTASRGKLVRAEPISALFQQGRCHLVGRSFDRLEEELCSYSPRALRAGSPDRMDALVWALTDLMVTGGTVDPNWMPMAGYSDRRGFTDVGRGGEDQRYRDPEYDQYWERFGQPSGLGPREF